MPLPPPDARAAVSAARPAAPAAGAVPGPSCAPELAHAAAATAGGGSCAESAGGGGGGEPTTVMMRNIPNRCTAISLLELLAEQGFQGLYDFVYLPIDFQNSVNL